MGPKRVLKAGDHDSRPLQKWWSLSDFLVGALSVSNRTAFARESKSWENSGKAESKEQKRLHFLLWWMFAFVCVCLFLPQPALRNSAERWRSGHKPDSSCLPDFTQVWKWYESNTNFLTFSRLMRLKDEFTLLISTRVFLTCVSDEPGVPAQSPQQPLYTQNCRSLLMLITNVTTTLWPLGLNSDSTHSEWAALVTSCLNRNLNFPQNSFLNYLWHFNRNILITSPSPSLFPSFPPLAK